LESEKINRLLTLGANLGVLVGIILILIELNQNAEMMKLQMTQARADIVVQSYLSQQHSDHWPSIRAKRRSAQSVEAWIGSLTPEEYERVFYHHLAEYHSIRNQHVQYQAGYLDEAIWQSSTRGQIERLAETWQYFFPGDAGVASPEFVEVLNQIAVDSGQPLFFRTE
jgi:hypothetical protein